MKQNKILIIDDEEDLSFFVKANLELVGNYEVGVVINGKDALKAAMTYKPDLILLDILMPKMDGFQVLKELKGSAKTASIPVIMLTARGDGESRIKAMKLYTEDYMVKPVQIDALDFKIKQVLKRVER